MAAVLLRVDEPHPVAASRCTTAATLATAIRASVAIPGILPPVPFDGDLLVDGGVLNNLPVRRHARRSETVGPVIAVDLSPAVGPRAQDDFGLSVSGWKALRAQSVAGSPGSPG